MAFVFSVMGDTVNIANTVEKMGEGMRIHMSRASKLLLAKVGGFRTEYRGIVDIGSKQIETYWLLGPDKDLDSNVLEPRDKHVEN